MHVTNEGSIYNIYKAWTLMRIDLNRVVIQYGFIMHKLSQFLV